MPLRPPILTFDGKPYNNHCADVEHSFNELQDGAWRFELRDGDQGWEGDPDDGDFPRHRAELGAYQPDGTLPKEVDLWIAYRLTVLPGDDNTALHVYLGQMHATPDEGDVGTSPSLSMRLGDAAETLQVVTYTSPDDPLVTPPSGVIRHTQPLVRGKQYNIVWNFIYSQTIGKTKVWIDGVLVVDDAGPHGYVDAEGPYPRFGIYRVGEGVMPPETIAAVYRDVEWGTDDLSHRITEQESQVAVTATLRAIFSARQVGTHDQGGPTFSPEIEKVLKFTSGTGANQADGVWTDTRQIAASSSEDLDLAGVLADAFGATVAAAELVAILVIADPTNTNNVVLGDATSPIPLFGGTNPTFAVKPGGFFYVAAPNAAGLLTVGAGSTDDLKIANSSSGSVVNYTIAVLFRTA